MKIGEEEMRIIKQQIKKLLDSGCIFETREGEFRGLDKNSDFYLKIEGVL